MSWWRKSAGHSADETTAPDPSVPVIRLEHVSKVYKGDADEETHALEDITVDIRRGEYVSVSGPSGCGKSTFLSILALLDTPSTGRYWLNGRATDRLSPAEKRAHPQSRRRPRLSELQSHRRHDGLRERRVPADPAWRSGGRTQRARGRGAGAGGTDGASEAAARIPLRRSSAAGRRRPGNHRTAADPAGRRADRQPGLEER